jgi:beta-mannosidase
VAFDGARLSDVHVLQDHATPGRVDVTVRVAAEQVTPAALEATVSLVFNGATVAEAATPLTAGGDDTAQGVAHLRADDPHLWWPNGMGEQPLYELTVSLCDGRGRVLDADRRRIGLRTLRLDRHPDEWGESFQFVVNGVPFFAKGANWIPADTFVSRLTQERYAQLLTDASAANMNMLRVWGGGIYESDDFYDLCDELGLCVWQDFIFSCGTYPTFDRAFMANVRAEAEDNVRRLRHHASLALWCGNNELEQGLVGDAWTDTTMSWEDYGRLFDELLPEVVARLDPETDYWPASPHTPVGDRGDFNNPDSGDAHLWNVWHGKMPFEWYRTCTHRLTASSASSRSPSPRR